MLHRTSFRHWHYISGSNVAIYLQKKRKNIISLEKWKLFNLVCLPAFWVTFRAMQNFFLFFGRNFTWNRLKLDINILCSKRFLISSKVQLRSLIISWIKWFLRFLKDCDECKILERNQLKDYPNTQYIFRIGIDYLKFQVSQWR